MTVAPRLFPLFSPRRTTSAATPANNLGTGGADLRRVSIGHRRQHGSRNSPTVLNARCNTAQFWDGRAADLVEQAGRADGQPG
jgi:cytochrome c peroxidase